MKTGVLSQDASVLFTPKVQGDGEVVKQGITARYTSTPYNRVTPTAHKLGQSFRTPAIIMEPNDDSQEHGQGRACRTHKRGSWATSTWQLLPSGA